VKTIDAMPDHRPWRFAIASALALVALGGAIGQGAVGAGRVVGPVRAAPALVAISPSPVPTSPVRPRPAPVVVRPPAVKAPAAILVDLGSGRVLFAKEPDLRRPIASLAKIMTALLVLRRTNLDDEVIVSRKAAKTPPTTIGLQAGEEIQVQSLLYGLLLHSGNDAAVALAEHVSGSVRAFVQLMNDEAAALGLADTHYASPNGLSDRGYSTVRDLAKLTRIALADPTFTQIVSSEQHWIPGPPGQMHRLRNLNLLLGAYPGTFGVKTGYTHAAGDCVVGVARRGGQALLAIELGDDPDTHWKDAYGDVIRLFDYGFVPTHVPSAPA
jgi:D-alanyl-D-alanine carboxypeptidase (penicillin-binding protein 5/6)